MTFTYPLPREGVRRLLEDLELVGTIARDQFEKDVRAQCDYCAGRVAGFCPEPVYVEDWLREMGGDRQHVRGAWAHQHQNGTDRTYCRADRIRKASPEMNCTNKGESE